MSNIKYAAAYKFLYQRIIRYGIGSRTKEIFHKFYKPVCRYIFGHCLVYFIQKRHYKCFQHTKLINSSRIKYYVCIFLVRENILFFITCYSYR